MVGGRGRLRPARPHPLSSAEGYLREPATDGTTIVFGSRGGLFAMDSLEAAPREIEVRTHGVGAARLPRPASPSANLLAMRPVHDARASVVEWRGSAHLLTHRGGPSRLLAGRCGLRLREAQPLGRCPYALLVSDEAAQADRTEGGVGSDRLALVRLDGSGEPIEADLGPLGRVLHAAPSPDGSRVAVSTSENAVHLVTLRGVEDPSRTAAQEAAPASAASAWEQDGAAEPTSPRLDGIRELGRSNGGEIRSLAWSPDGRYLVWTEPDSWMLGRLMISDVQDADPIGRALTSGKYQDSEPAFSADGKHLAMLSLRTFETAYDDMVFDLGFVNAERPHLIPLQRITEDPFGPHPDGWSASAEPAKPAADTGSGADAAEPTTTQASAAETAPTPPVSASSPAGADAAEAAPRTVVDLEDVEERVVPFPVPSGSYSHLTAVSGGFVWLRHPQATELGAARAGVEGEDPAPTLEHWSLDDRKLTVLAEGVTELWAAGDGESLVIRQGEAFVQLPATRKAEEEDPARIVIDTSRLRLTVDPVAERRGCSGTTTGSWRSSTGGPTWMARTGTR